MKRILDIIIPHYKESLDDIKSVLSSINSQLDIDFNDINVTIITDGIENRILLPINNYNFNIDYIVRDSDVHRAGLTRQYGLDRTNSDYIMFIDSDDTLADSFVLKYFLNTIKNNSGIETIFTGYLEEVVLNDEKMYRVMNDDTSIGCLHGKVYKREFLEKFNIRFDDFYIGEDAAFNFKVICFSEDAVFDDEIITYIYKYNKNSITKKDSILVKNKSILTGAVLDIKSFIATEDCWRSFFKIIINDSRCKIKKSFIGRFIESNIKFLDYAESIPNLTDIDLIELQKCKNLMNIFCKDYEQYFAKEED